MAQARKLKAGANVTVAVSATDCRFYQSLPCLVAVMCRWLVGLVMLCTPPPGWQLAQHNLTDLRLP